jgi:hypothetical protein
MKIAKLVARDGGGGDGAKPTIRAPTRLVVNDEETQATSDHIEILLEGENQSPVEEKRTSHGAVPGSYLDGSSGVEVVTVPVAPILSSDTSFTLSKTFGDESMIAEAIIEHLSIVGSKEQATIADQVGADGLISGDRERIEMALNSDKEPLYKKFWGFVPVTPRGLRQQELNVVIDEKTAPQEDPLNEFESKPASLAECQQRSTEDSSAHKVLEGADPTEDMLDKDTTLAKATDQKLLLQCEAASLPVHGISPRFIGRVMNLKSPTPLSTEIDSVPTYDTRAGIVKEQFEATIDCSDVTMGKKWKSVAFGLGLSNPHNSIKGNLKSILRMRTSEPKATGSSTTLDSCGPKDDSEISTEGEAKRSTGPVVEFKLKEGQIWPRRRVPSFTRPYSDRGSAHEGVELVKHAFGSRQHSFLRSITFDDEQVSQLRVTERVGNWMPLRRSRSEVIQQDHFEQCQDEKREPDENQRDELAMAKEKSPSVMKNQQTDVIKASPSTEKDGSVIVKEYFLPMEIHPVKPQPASVLGEITAANTDSLKVLPCPVTQSAPLEVPNKLLRKTSTTAKVDRFSTNPSNHHYYQHISHGKDKKTGGLPRLVKALAGSESKEIERKIQEVAKARMRPNQSLQDALDELEVELLEARNGKSREIRDTMFRRIRKQTERRIVERGGTDETPQPESH